MKISLLTTAVCLLSTAMTASGEPLTIDLTTDVPTPAASPYGPGTSKNPKGQQVSADTQSFLLDGKPWAPIAGEYHFSRYARDEWRDELLKMKAGGINVVSTYVFWNHHEEERGKFDWTGQRSLRDFLKVTQEVGLKAIVRMGPYCHGEARHGGITDWAQNSGTRVRQNDPAFLKLVEPFFREQAAQMKGLLWKDGGPVIGIQVDNESERGDYVLALKKMAIDAGVDVPLYMITGWQGGVPREGLIPLFGGYTYGFWGGSHEHFRKDIVFTPVRQVNDMGAQLSTTHKDTVELLARFPYGCIEIGPGMMSAYDVRVDVDPDDAATMAMVKMGSGSNMPGYYMYHGGTNPDGKLTTLQETSPNKMPIKDYDYQSCLDSRGQARKIFHLLREQHLFLETFGAQLVRMATFFPDRMPRDIKDSETFRWAVRSDGKASFLFFSNRQPSELLPEHTDVQFELKTAGGSMRVPGSPITIPTGSYGIWPVNLDCDGVTISYATAQPICRVQDGKDAWYFFTATAGIAPELSLAAGANDVTVDVAEKAEADGRTLVRGIAPGTGRAASVRKADGTTVNFVVLTPEQALQLYRIPLGGQDRAVLSPALVFRDGPALRLQSPDAKDLSLSVFPAMKGAKFGAAPTVTQGIFTGFVAPPSRPSQTVPVALTLEKPAGPKATSLKGGTDESTWNDAAVYKLQIPATAAKGRTVLDIVYTGDAARLYVGDKLFNDNYYDGASFSTAVWRIPQRDWSKVRLKVLPYSDGLFGRLPAAAKEKVERAKNDSTLDRIKATATEVLELRLDAPAK